jgi:multiple sugar transport system substrate-binding protein
MFQFEERYFPWGAYQNQFEAVCGFIDFSRPEWNATRDVMELFEWGGKNYTAITALTNSTALLYYRDSVRQSAQLPDPQDLWRQNRWTWNEFTNMVEQFSEPDEKWGIMGFLIDEAAILSTGTAMISLENGILRSNTDDRRIERAMNLLQNLALNDFRYPHHILNDYQLRHSEFRGGNVLFVQDGWWRFQEMYRRYAEDDGWSEDELRVVPFPQDPEADRFYTRGNHTALMWVTGSLNRDGFLAWTYSALAAASSGQDPLAGQGWSARNLAILEELRDPTRVTLVWDFKNGIGQDISCVVSESPVERLTKPVIMYGYPFAHQRDSERLIISNRVAMINERVQS